MATAGFDPFGEALPADPYPQFARFVRAATFSAANSLAPLTPPCARAGAALAQGGSARSRR